MHKLQFVYYREISKIGNHKEEEWNYLIHTLAFSGGKDSICLFYICKKACERIGESMESLFDVVYSNTTIDPPEL